METQPRVKSLHVYPVKSCGGISLQTAQVEPRGFRFDRRWTIVGGKQSKFISQRQYAKLALISTDLPADVLNGGNEENGALVLNAPGKTAIEVPLDSSTAKKKRECKVWEWRGDAEDEGDEVADWLSDYVGKSVRLVKFIGDREANHSWAGPGHPITFADGFPYLIASQGSMNELNEKMPSSSSSILIDQFRPNIVLDGSMPWGEDTWHSIGKAQAVEGGEEQWGMRLVKPCSRCQNVTINQSTSESQMDSLTTLMEIRSGKLLGWDNILSPSDCFFGWYAVAEISGQMTIGDVLNVVQRKDKLALASPAQ